MGYNPDRHNRHSIRLRGYDYAAGAYFVTVCCQNRMHYFGEIENEKMILNDYGNIAYNEWKKLSERYLETKFDIFQIMPDHIHGIIEINVGATLAVTQFHNDAQTHDGTTANANTNANGATARVSPLQLGVLSGRINHWFLRNVWKYQIKINAVWGNYGNVIIMNV